MESIEQPIFSTYSEATDDKEELIDETVPKKSQTPSSPDSNTNNVHAEKSPLHAAKSLLSSGKQAMADQSKGLCIIVVCTVVFAVIITVALILTIYLVPKQRRLPYYCLTHFLLKSICLQRVGGHAAVATEVPECSEVGLDVIKEGGNAVDAAISAAFCLSVIHAQSSGIGGGGFLLYHDHKNEDSQAYDFRETAPAGASQALLSGDLEDLAVSGAAVGVPGELKGLAQVHQDYGHMKWSDLLQPAIDLALHGFNVTPALAQSLANHVDEGTLPGGQLNGILKHYYVDGRFVAAGDIVKRPDLASTLQVIADEGSDAFYLGNLGQSFVRMVSQYGGIMTAEDLKQYTVVKQKPVVSGFKGFKVLGMPAPSSGPIVALMLNMIEGFNWTSSSASSFLTYQQMIETFKFGYAHRAWLGDPADPAFTDAIKNATSQFLSDDFAATLREKVGNSTHRRKFYGPELPAALNKGTTHLSVVDTNEVMVSLTLTLNDWFGAKLMTEDGILANNEMLDFSTSKIPVAGDRNLIAPGKRPLSSMVPTIIYNADKPCAKRAIIGASNGTRIITGVVETLVNSFVFDMNITEAIARPRIHQQLDPSDVTEYEDFSKTAPGRGRFPAAIVSDLTALGQTMVPVSEGLSTVQGIVKINDDVYAYSDWRKFGKVAEF